jgi:protein SCO1/2
VQNRLVPDTQKVQLISISLDPEHDTPQIMMGYLKTFRAKPGWDFLSGSPEDTITIMKAFGLREMSFNYFTLIRTSPDSCWIKITGRLNAAEIVDEYILK